MKTIGSVFDALRAKIALNPLRGGEPRINAQNSSSRPEVPQAKAALDSMKYEIARELGINLKQGYNGDLSSRENGYVGGYMVKRLIEQAERQMAGTQH